MEKPRDPIGFELFKNTLLSIADEMALTILRTAYSGVLKDNMDYSTAFCDGSGRTIAQGLTLPAHLSSFPDALAATIARFGDRMQPGDVYCLNDPFEGGMHIPDVFVLKPIFHEGERLAFAATICHQTDMGGRVAGSNASDSTEIYQEGLRIPPVKMYEAGRAERDAVPPAREEHPHAGPRVRRPPRPARRLPHRRDRVPPSGRPPRRQAGPGVHGGDPRLHRAPDAGLALRAARRRMVIRGLDRRRRHRLRQADPALRDAAQAGRLARGRLDGDVAAGQGRHQQHGVVHEGGDLHLPQVRPRARRACATPASTAPST